MARTWGNQGSWEERSPEWGRGGQAQARHHGPDKEPGLFYKCNGKPLEIFLRGVTQSDLL